MEYFIENDRLKVGSVAKGAELSTVIRKSDGREMLWQGGELWSRKSPLLFPVVGNLKGGKLTVDGKDYTMPAHGFARDSEFDLIKQDKTSVTYRLLSSEQTQEVYPYEFELYVTYTLIGSCLDVNFEVENPSGSPIYFSIGGHPAFNCNSAEGSFGDWYIEFEQPETAGRYFKRGLLSDKPGEFLDGAKVLKLSGSLFENDALVFKDIKSEYVSLKNIEDDTDIRVYIKDFPVLVLWSKGDRFVCIEPCEGCDDAESFDGDITKKQFIVRLAPGETYDKSYRIRIKGGEAEVSE